MMAAYLAVRGWSSPGNMGLANKTSHFLQWLICSNWLSGGLSIHISAWGDHAESLLDSCNNLNDVKIG